MAKSKAKKGELASKGDLEGVATAFAIKEAFRACGGRMSKDMRDLLEALNGEPRAASAKASRGSE